MNEKCIFLPSNCQTFSKTCFVKTIMIHFITKYQSYHLCQEWDFFLISHKISLHFKKYKKICSISSKNICTSNFVPLCLKLHNQSCQNKHVRQTMLFRTWPLVPYPFSGYTMRLYPFWISVLKYFDPLVFSEDIKVHILLAESKILKNLSPVFDIT